ncbi:hypothetical protein [Acinetobacter equi]|uniref:Lipoprotein n=1 Tax=Acinetobacter equi TaxID=1324350 RepID=A0A0N9VFX4_9GAMM|nr:hypothetical protein [Acinetobacter equi]ALH96478.1 hypothetical protein AOY20_13510 [Acinetobacter equi]
MKKLLLSTLCVSMLALTACGKNETTSSTNHAEASSAVVYSSEVVVDMRSDLDQIQTLSNAKAQEALQFQTSIAEAVQKGKRDEVTKVVDQMKKYVDGFNKDLDGLHLKSTEGDNLRNKIKEVNNIGVELAVTGMNVPPNMDKIAELQKNAMDLQQSLLQDMQKIQSKTVAK